HRNKISKAIHTLFKVCQLFRELRRLTYFIQIERSAVTAKSSLTRSADVDLEMVQQEGSLQNNSTAQSAHYIPPSTLLEFMFCSSTDTSLHIPYKELTFGEVLGKGFFGEVRVGR